MSLGLVSTLRSARLCFVAVMFVGCEDETLCHILISLCVKKKTTSDISLWPKFDKWSLMKAANEMNRQK